MISKSASRRIRRARMKNPTWQERMNYQRNEGRKKFATAEIPQVEAQIQRFQIARATGNPLRNEKGHFLSSKSLRTRYEQLKTWAFGHGRQSVTA